jgi:hypothetical protein
LRLIATQVFAEIWPVKYRVSSPEMQMSNRTAKFVSAIFASLLAGVAVTTIAQSTARAADDCLAGPKEQTPPGGHWYYRIDHATKRHCWYLGDEREKLSRVAPRGSAPSANPVLANPVSPQKDATTPQTIADARAELPLPQTRVEATSSTNWPRTPANAADMENSQPANSRDTNTQPSLIASRWPEPSGLSSSAVAGPATADSEANGQPNSAAALPPVVAAVPLAAADSSSVSRAGSIQMLLIVIAGALALAGIMAAAVFRFGRMRQAARREIRGGRRAIWDSVDTGRPSPAPFAIGDLPRRRVDIPRELREADDPNRRIAEMLARLHSSAAN